MASRFFTIYVALRDGTTLNEQEFDQFLYHIRLEISQKYRGYMGIWLSNDEHLHEDLFQQVLAEIASGIHKGNFNPEMGTFKNWVDGLVHNTVRKHFTRQKRQQNEQSLEQLVDDGALWVDDMESTPEELLLKNYDVTIVRKAMRVLCRKHLKYFQVLYCRTFHELSTSETAELLGTSTHDISRTLNRAKEKLREIILEIETPVPNRK